MIEFLLLVLFFVGRLVVESIRVHIADRQAMARIASRQALKTLKK